MIMCEKKAEPKMQPFMRARTPSPLKLTSGLREMVRIAASEFGPFDPAIFLWLRHVGLSLL
jgi:hypothetical protein